MNVCVQSIVMVQGLTVDVIFYKHKSQNIDYKFTIWSQKAYKTSLGTTLLNWS